MSTTARHFDAIYRYQEGVTIKSVGAPAVGPGLAEDGRGQRLVITEEGRAILLSMWPIYAKAIQDILGSGLLPSEIEILSELLRKIKLPEV